MLHNLVNGFKPGSAVETVNARSIYNRSFKCSVLQVPPPKFWNHLHVDEIKLGIYTYTLAFCSEFLQIRCAFYHCRLGYLKKVARTSLKTAIKGSIWHYSQPNDFGVSPSSSPPYGSEPHTTSMSVRPFRMAGVAIIGVASGSIANNSSGY